MYFERSLLVTALVGFGLLVPTLTEVEVCSILSLSFLVFVPLYPSFYLPPLLTLHHLFGSQNVGMKHLNIPSEELQNAVIYLNIK
jgi:hypothetical protein